MSTASTSLEPPRILARTRTLVLLVAAAAIAAYANTLGHTLVYDDVVIRQNPLMQAPGDVLGIFAAPYYGPLRADVDLYRPFTVWTLAWNWGLNRLLGLAGDHPASFHAFNVLAHACVSALVFVWLDGRKLGRWLAAAAALLFAAHPLHTEAVANVMGRAEVLALGLGLTFAVLHDRGRHALAGVAFFLALCSKESVVGFLPLVVLLDRLRPAAERPALLRAYGPGGAALALYFALRVAALQGVEERPAILENPLMYVSLGERLLTAAAVQIEYLRLLALPVGLSSDYSYDQIPVVRSAGDPRVIAFLVLVSAAAFSAWRWRRTLPALTLAVLGYALLFAPTANFVLAIGVVMGERLAYAPSLFFCVLGALGLARLALAFGAPTGNALLAAAVLALGLLTVQQNRVWRDDLTLFQAQARSAPRSAKAHLNLGTALSQAGDDAAAIPAFEASLRIYPQNSQTWYALGISQYNLRVEPVKVITSFQNALRYGPMHHDARAKLAIVFFRCGHPEEGRKLVEELQRLAPGHPDLARLRGM